MSKYLWLYLLCSCIYALGWMTCGLLTRRVE